MSLIVIIKALRRDRPPTPTPFHCEYLFPRSAGLGVFYVCCVFTCSPIQQVLSTMCQGLGISTSAIVFSPPEEGQTVFADCLSHDENAINISCYCYFIVMLQYGGPQTNSVIYTVITSQLWTQENHISRRKRRNYIYLFQIIYFKEPSTRKVDSPPLMSQYDKFRDSPVKSEAPWGQVHSRKCSKDADRQYPPALSIAVQGPFFVHCR